MAKYYTRVPSKKTKPFGRVVDSLAGEGSIAGILKKQRSKFESGDIGDENSTDMIVKRGYSKETDYE